MTDEQSTPLGRVGAVVLGAGTGSRFGGGKLLALLDGLPVIRHVVDAARGAGLDPIVVVAPPDASLASLDLGEIRSVTNPHPEEGLSSSVRLGLRSFLDDVDVAAAVILPGDQPRVRADTISALVSAADESPRTPFVIARHVDDGVPSPVLSRRSMWRLADEIAGDRGFGPIVATHPELVREVVVAGTNPDIDTPADLHRVASGAARPEDPLMRR
jgi:molybdenum cofactor cytidylyltransferase